MAIFENQELSPREYVLLENERDEARLVREHAAHLKQLEITLSRERNEAEIELKTLEAKWSSWLRIPIIIIKLPLYLLLGIGYIVCSMRGEEPPKKFWDLIK